MNPSLGAAGAASCRARPRKPFFALACALSLALAPRSPAAPPPLSAEPARLAAQSLLIAIAAAGPRLVAVGDHGIVVLSDDQGGSWVQAVVVPTQALLTGVCFFDGARGVAVGHDEVIVTTADGGRSWRLAHYAPEAERPLLDVWCGSDGHALAVGAYSTVLASNDAGASWSAREFAAAALPGGREARATTAKAAEETAARGGYHLNRIVSAGGARLYIAGEAGHLYRSDDGGASWWQLDSPYQGSFFGVLPLGRDALLAFGLRGNLYRSDDAGASWQSLATGAVDMLDGATRWGDDGVAVVGLAGVVLVSHDAGRSFALLQQSERAGLSAALALGAGRLAVVGEGGVRLISLDGGPPAPGGDGAVH